MTYLPPRYIVDAEGERTEVIISVEEYQRLLAAAGEKSSAGGSDLVADDEVLGMRPDGTPVTAGEAVGGWDAAVEEVLAGGGLSFEQVTARLRERRLSRG